MKGIRWLLVWMISGLTGAFSGCGGSLVASHDDGRLFVVNNTIFWNNFGDSAGDYSHIVVEWEGQQVPIPRNMDDEGNFTGVGAVEIISEPLPGRTR